MKHLYKNKKFDKCIRVPVRPEDAPEKMVFSNNLVIEDENQWLYDLYENMKTLLSKAIDPLNEYIQKFDPYKKVISIDPEEKIKELDPEDIENQCELKELTQLIEKYEKNIKNIEKSLPEEIQVSIFAVNCKELTKTLIGKY